jgi:MFS transporter, DHA1 family, inner membrane transport protein
MPDSTAQHLSETREKAVISAFLFGNFLIGTAVMLAPGLLLVIANDLGVSAQQASLMISVSAIVIGIGAPVLATLTSRIDRRSLLACALGLYVVGHLAAAAAPNLFWLILARTFGLLGAAIFTPQAAATLNVALAPERRAAAITSIFVGWSIASVVGAPLGAWLGAHIGWRWTFVLFAIICVPGAIWVARVVPAKLAGVPLSRESWIAVAKHPALFAILLVTVAYSSGQFTVFAFVAPYVQEHVGGGAATLTLSLLFVGVAGVIGNVWASRRIATAGAASNLRISLSFMLVGMVAITFTHGVIAAFLAACFVWGLGTFSSNSSQQARLATIAPPLAGASIALNTTMIYAGQAIGASIGAIASAQLGIHWLGLVGASLVALALTLSIRAERQ